MCGHKRKYGHVVWHGTAGRTLHTPSSGRPGRATTSIDGWNLDALRVGAPYLVDRDGTIYRTFDDSAWIYHLGIKGTNGRYDKSSVAIEFANEQGSTHAERSPRIPGGGFSTSGGLVERYRR
jgi:hypothetical protein